ncbi:Crotonobetainyl-CoA:carnitine CoA-transferase CaiB [Xaviernesmea oryzae]|uniref:Crotonobetainyl-CoA:carnitine CoA-transferase CaiB n=1 Tax=Xaviernesmea oryzae TaxID=464029 RepID=A0A1X7DCM1_9HYPH|nr:CaiB/BaiF CoA-transferase family protein [Xaviernesmea oryzae]SMF12959.1 Crotonobetainyl-CoA:carnitine CoA-transferase CaiB [Xaviernesmea oryzae]
MLSGIRIISLCHYLQGPAAAQYLTDMGADVIKVEPIGGAYERRWSGAKVFVGEVSGFYLCANKNKRSICINLKSPEGRAAFLRLVSTADVVMENFRPGTLDRLGLGYEALQEAKPDIIFASASGYGADGPYAELPGQDLLIQARTGLVAATAGQAPGILPAAAGCAIVDQHGAALFALGIGGAIIRKLRTGRGTRVESSLFNAGIDLQAEAITNYLNGAKTPEVFKRDGHLATWFHEAPYGIYETADGRHIAMSLNALGLLDEALGPSELAKDDTLDAYLERDRVAADVAARLARLTLSEAETALSRHKVWFAPVTNYSELARDPQAQHNQVFANVTVSGQSAILVNHPNRYDGAVPGLRHIAERPGQDTVSILTGSGFGAQEIAALLDRGAVA